MAQTTIRSIDGYDSRLLSFVALQKQSNQHSQGLNSQKSNRSCYQQQPFGGAFFCMKSTNRERNLSCEREFVLRVVERICEIRQHPVIDCINDAHQCVWKSSPNENEEEDFQNHAENWFNLLSHLCNVARKSFCIVHFWTSKKNYSLSTPLLYKVTVTARKVFPTTKIKY